MTRYDLAYRLIPTLISEFNRGRIKEYVLFDKNYFFYFLENQNLYFEIDEFNIQFKKYNDFLYIVFYKFPNPIEPPQALFGLLFLDKNSKKTKYYTLEKSIPREDGNERWITGLSNELGTHVNLGEYIGEINSDNFINYCIKIHNY